MILIFILLSAGHFICKRTVVNIVNYKLLFAAGHFRCISAFDNCICICVIFNYNQLLFIHFL